MVQECPSAALNNSNYAQGVMSQQVVPGVRGEFQVIVANLMRTLLEEHPTLLGERQIADLMDAEYCKGVLGLSLSNFAPPAASRPGALDSAPRSVLEACLRWRVLRLLAVVEGPSPGQRPRPVEVCVQARAEEAGAHGSWDAPAICRGTQPLRGGQRSLKPYGNTRELGRSLSRLSGCGRRQCRFG